MARSFRNRKGLTARTLKSEVLPAFCKPIMVMSISVALDVAGSQHSSLVIVAHDFAFSWTELDTWEVSNGASGTQAGAFEEVEEDR
jgi:hypothetical protein